MICLLHFEDFMFWDMFDVFTGGNGKGCIWEIFLEAIRFILAKYGTASSYDDPACANK